MTFLILRSCNLLSLNNLVVFLEEWLTDWHFYKQYMCYNLNVHVLPNSYWNWILNAIVPRFEGYREWLEQENITLNGMKYWWVKLHSVFSHFVLPFFSPSEDTKFISLVNATMKISSWKQRASLSRHQTYQ
jgi:hypothetical protein